MKIQARKQYKDTVFRMLFQDKEHLLELYNAVSGRHCTDSGMLEIVTLENAIYMGVKNDLAFLVDFQLYLYEHQSTVNLNMPFRFLQYVDKVRDYTAFMPMPEAVDRAVDECIEEEILKDFLLANKAEIKHMSIYEYDEEAIRQAIRIEEYERGMEALILDNIENGFKQEIIIGKLMKRFGISEAKAEACYENVMAALQKI